MICLSCKKKFYVKRNFYDLFSTKKYYLCDNCFNNNKLEPNVEVLIECNNVMIINLLKFRPRFCYDVYFNELSQIVSYYVGNIDYFMLFFDEIYLNLTVLEILDWLSEIIDKQIVIICFLKLN